MLYLKKKAYKPKKSFITATPTTVNKMVYILFPSMPTPQTLPAH